MCHMTSLKRRFNFSLLTLFSNSEFWAWGVEITQHLESDTEVLTFFFIENDKNHYTESFFTSSYNMVFERQMKWMISVIYLSIIGANDFLLIIVQAVLEKNGRTVRCVAAVQVRTVQNSAAFHMRSHLVIKLIKLNLDKLERTFTDNICSSFNFFFFPRVHTLLTWIEKQDIYPQNTDNNLNTHAAFKLS